MYNRVLAFIALAAGLLLLQCSDKPTQPEQVKLGELHTFSVGRSVPVQGEDLSVAFRGVISDSRCPFNALCFWAGIAEIQVALNKTSGDTALVTLGVLGGTRYNAERPYYVDTLGYRLSLLRLDPYPEGIDKLRMMTPPQPLLEYQATLVITRSTAIAVEIDSVRITNLPPDSVQLDHFAIDSISIVGDTLSLTVEYGGGCKNHYFFLFMSPATFAESIPVQANLWLRHFDNNDSCKCEGGKCYNHRNLRFDLRPIAELCRQRYGELRSVILNVFQFVGQYPEQRHTARYEPIGLTNHAPVISLCCSSGTDSVKEGERLFITVRASDSDGTDPVVQAKNLPANAGFWKSQDDYTFRFEPNYKQSGTYHILFTASDGSAIDSAIAPIVVIDAGNQLPRWINGIWPSEVTEGKILQCRLSAYDPDGNKLYLTAENLPNNCTFVDSGNGRAGFVFYPYSSEIGTHIITFVATDDSGGAVSMDNTIVVKKWINQKPEILAGGTNWFVAEDDTLVIGIRTFDIDGGIPSLLVSNLPPNATFTYANQGAGRVDFYPAAGQAGQYSISCIACDAWDSLLCDTLNISVTVQAVTQNQGPLIPVAVGNYWVYGNDTVDSTEIVSMSEIDGETWWNLSPALLFGQRLRSNGDSVFNEKGLQFVAASDTAVLFEAGPGFLRYSGSEGPCQVKRLAEYVTVPAGTFANCYQYSREWRSDASWSGSTMIIAPGVGVISVEWYVDYRMTYYHESWALEKYRLR